jgi:Flp pilus assembly protein TadD
MPDAWYAMRFPLDPTGSSNYGRSLSTREVLGVTAFNIGNELRRHEQLQPAALAYTRAVADFPGFAEAHAGLGAIQQLLGNRGAASRCYARALELDPTLPGVEKNLALLGPSP